MILGAAFVVIAILLALSVYFRTITLLPLIALLLTYAALTLFQINPLQGIWAQYLAVACLAGIDTVCGGIRSALEGKFEGDIFITGFVANVAIAFFLGWLGDQIFLNLFLAVALVLGMRIFNNLSFIRRILLQRWQDYRKRKALQTAPMAGDANL